MHAQPTVFLTLMRFLINFASVDTNRIIPLNLPPAQLSMRNTAAGHAEIYDSLRRKFVALTPEEWVRQHFVAYLIGTLGYNPALMANEAGLVQNGIRRRCDTVVYDTHGRPAVIVEYKAPAVKVSQRVFNQIVRYNMVLRAPVLVVSNGLTHYCCLVDYALMQCRFVKAVPSWEEVKALCENR